MASIYMAQKKMYVNLGTHCQTLTTSRNEAFVALQEGLKQRRDSWKMYILSIRTAN